MMKKVLLTLDLRFRIPQSLPMISVMVTSSIHSLKGLMMTATRQWELESHICFNPQNLK